MTVSEFEQLAPLYLSGTCSAAQRTAMESYLEAHPGQQEELEQLSRLWEKLGELPLPEPGPAMDSRFQELLSDRIAAAGGARVESHRGSLWRRRTAVPNWLLAACLLIGGFLMGRYGFQSSLATRDSDAVNLTLTDFEANPKTVMTLLEEPLASERLKGINRVAEMSSADEQVIRALLQTLITDTNVNVRLAAIEALRNYTDIPLVREGLVAAIRHQDSPLVQISLAELMAAIQESRSVDAIKTLIEQEQTDSIVKAALRESLRRII